MKELKISRSTERLQNTSKRSRGARTDLASLPRSASPFWTCALIGTPAIGGALGTLEKKNYLHCRVAAVRIPITAIVGLAPLVTEAVFFFFFFGRSIFMWVRLPATCANLEKHQVLSFILKLAHLYIRERLSFFKNSIHCPE